MIQNINMFLERKKYIVLQNKVQTVAIWITGASGLVPKLEEESFKGTSHHTKKAPHKIVWELLFCKTMYFYFFINLIKKNKWVTDIIFKKYINNIKNFLYK